MPASTCVYCRRQPPDPQWHPFCSERCRLSDLGRWLQGDYRVPGPSVNLEGDASAEDDDPPGLLES